MSTLVFGFYGEGPRDYGFLIPIIQRTLINLLPDISIFDPIEIRVQEPNLDQIQKMETAARKGFGLGLLVIHLDADSSTTDEAYQKRFDPGYLHVQAIDDDVITDIVPIIPVRMTDAWMLVDFEAFSTVVGTRERASSLGFPDRPQQVESISDPKHVFETAIRKTAQRRGKKIDASGVYRPLAERINLELLEKVPAYQEFTERLTDTLIDIHYLDPD